MDRRTTIKWMLAASVSMPFIQGCSRESSRAATNAAISRDYRLSKAYGTDPNLLRTYKPGELWPLTLTAEQRRAATALCDLIIPADAHSPSASAVGVVDFIDEWISAPYMPHAADRKLVLDGLGWIDKESKQRFSKRFRALKPHQQSEICDEICYLPKVTAERLQASRFFARYRDLTAGGFYTTPAGRKDLRYVGNTPLPSFEGPPLEVLRQVGLA